jgi:hypothetical protein
MTPEDISATIRNLPFVWGELSWADIKAAGQDKELDEICERIKKFDAAMAEYTKGQVK